MVGSDVRWIEALTQMSIVFPFCFVMEKSVGYRKLQGKTSGWIPAALVYSVWNLYNVVVLQYPEFLKGIIPIYAAYKIRAITGLTIMLIVLPWLYKGTIVERYFACFLIEVVSLMSGLFRFVSVLVVKSNGIYVRIAKSLWVLLIFRLLIECIPYFVCYFIMKRQFKNYHTIVSKHKKICCVAIIVIIVLEIVTAFITISKSFQDIWRGIAGSLFVFAVIGAVIYLLKRDNNRIYLQKQLVENHYQSVKAQEEKIINMQSEIGNLLQAAKKLEQQTKFSKEDLKYYESELKKIYHQLEREEYCNNIVLDALLHNKRRVCEKNNITLNVEMQGINLGNIEEIDLFEIVNVMLELAIGQATLQEEVISKRITIGGKNLTGQVVIEISFPQTQKNLEEKEKQYRRLKRKVKKHGGRCVCNTEEQMKKIIVGIKCV